MQSLVQLTTFVLYVNVDPCTRMYEEPTRCLDASEDCSGKHGSARRPEDMRVRKPGGLGGLGKLLWETWQRREARRHASEDAGRYPEASKSCCGQPGNTRTPGKTREEAGTARWPAKFASGSMEVQEA